MIGVPPTVEHVAPKLDRSNNREKKLFDQLSSLALKNWEGKNFELAFRNLKFLKGFVVEGPDHQLNNSSTQEEVKKYINELKKIFDDSESDYNKSRAYPLEDFDNSEMVKIFKEIGFYGANKIIVIVPDLYNPKTGEISSDNGDISGYYGEGIKLILPNNEGYVVLTALHVVKEPDDTSEKAQEMNSGIRSVKLSNLLVLNTESDDPDDVMVDKEGNLNKDIEVLPSDVAAWYFKDPRVSEEPTIIGTRRQVNLAAKLLLKMNLASSYEIRAALASSTPLVGKFFSNRITEETSKATGLQPNIAGLYTSKAYQSNVSSVVTTNSVDFSAPGQSYVIFSTPGTDSNLQPRVTFSGSSGAIGITRTEKGKPILSTYFGVTNYGELSTYDPKAIEIVKKELNDNPKLRDPYIRFLMSKYPDMKYEDALHTLASLASRDGLSITSHYTSEFIINLILSTSESKSAPNIP